MRTSDTKLPRAWPQARSEFPSVRRITDRRGKILGLCQDERAKARQPPMRHARSNREHPGACGGIFASPAGRAVPARHGVLRLSGSQAADPVASPAAGVRSRMP
jgi:hypothetical protein